MDRRSFRLTLAGIGMAWDVAWKIVAIRRAIRVRQFGWIAPLAVANTLGLLPILYLKRWARPEAVSPPAPAR